MKKTVLCVFVLCFLVSCSFTGVKRKDKTGQACKVVSAAQSEKDKKKAEAERELETVVKEAQPIIKNLLQAINNNEYDKFINNFDAGMKSTYHDKKMFYKTNKDRLEKYGQAGARPVWKVEKTNPFYNIYYLVKFSKISQPVPVFLSLKREDGDLKIAFFQLQFSRVKTAPVPAVD